MRVLMFGWEFPPHIAGGLGTASYGLTRGLARNGVEVIFVVPKAYGDEDQRFVRIVNASDVEALYESGEYAGELWKRVSFIQIDSNLVPYSSPEEFASLGEAYRKAGEKRTFPGEVWRERYNFSGRYGANLMEEVARYATVAAQVARDLAGKFDVIHAHDWLTYYAGMAAKAGGHGGCRPGDSRKQPDTQHRHNEVRHSARKGGYRPQCRPFFGER